MRKMLPGFGVVGTPNSVRAYVPLLRSYGFKVVALWGRTKEDAAKVAAELNIPFHSSNVDEVNNLFYGIVESDQVAHMLEITRSQ